MSLQIVGRNNEIVRVSPTGELYTLNLTPLAFATLEGRAYSFSNVTYDPDTADTIMLLRNTGTKNFHICELTVSSDILAEWFAHIVTAVFIQAGTLSIVPVNLNSNFGDNSGITATGDETANVRGAVVHPHMRATADGVSLTYNYDGALVIAPTHAFGLDIVGTTPATAYASITGYVAAE